MDPFMFSVLEVLESKRGSIRKKLVRCLLEGKRYCGPILHRRVGMHRKKLLLDLGAFVGCQGIRVGHSAHPDVCCHVSSLTPCSSMAHNGCQEALHSNQWDDQTGVNPLHAMRPRPSLHFPPESMRVG